MKTLHTVDCTGKLTDNPLKTLYNNFDRGYKSMGGVTSLWERALESNSYNKIFVIFYTTNLDKTDWPRSSA